MDMVGQQGKPINTMPHSLLVEKEERSARLSIHCDLCGFTTQELKPSKAAQRMKSHHSCEDIQSQPWPSSSCHVAHRSSGPPSLPAQEDPSASYMPCRDKHQAWPSLFT